MATLYQSVKIVPYRFYLHKDGVRKMSIFSAAPPDPENWEVKEEGFTWECVSHRGTVTRGACRVPAKTYEEAVEVRDKLIQEF